MAKGVETRNNGKPARQGKGAVTRTQQICSHGRGAASAIEHNDWSSGKRMYAGERRLGMNSPALVVNATFIITAKK